MYRNAFRPLLPDIFLVGFNDDQSLDSIDNNTACVIIEPIQGEAGVIYPEDAFLEKIRKKCDLTGTLLIFDEIQTGFGRIGSMFAIDRFGVVPDILLLAKALGGGMPLGAFISSHEIMSALISNPPLGHITTFGGHPVCCAAGLASLDVIIEEKLVETCNSKSTLFKKELNHPLISEVRGEGLLMAVQLIDPEYIHYIIAAAPDYGLILDDFLFCNTAFRIAPPLVISEEEISLACRQLKKLLDNAISNVKKK
jgi:acetylornithine/succinyldiaminopimelate/putrescine aminotransferase